MSPDDPHESWNASGDGEGSVYWQSVADSGFVSTGCDDAPCNDGDDGDSFYFTPPELEDANEVQTTPRILFAFFL
jgi:hypothetical protein